MWPFQKKKIDMKGISFSQLDSTEGFDDNQNINPDVWIETTPLNSMVDDPETMGLPSPDANEDEIYRLASELSSFRESISIPNDGVYCPICHITNIDLDKLRTPCPKCGRELLKFGWD